MSLLAAVRESLYEVYDPELGINVMDLGLVYDTDVDDENNVTITMTLTTPGCPLHDSITTGVKNQVGQIDGIGQVDVQIVWEPAWSPNKMSDRGKELLGF